MSLEAFSFPLPETRLFKAGGFVYKFKIRGGSSYSGEEVIRENYINQELEDIIRAVLANLDCLQPFSSAHFSVFPYKKQWEKVPKLMLKDGEEKLAAYPFTITLHLESNTQGGKKAEDKLKPETSLRLPSSCEPLPKRSRSDLPLEEAIIKELIMDSEIGAHTADRTYVDSSHTEEEKGAGNDDQCPHLLLQKGPEQFVGSAGMNTQVPTALDEEQHTGTAEEDKEEEEERVDSTPQPPARPGLLKQLASHIFPFSVFFKES